MADILIKNMEMPKNCLWCEIRDCTYGNDLYLERPNDCPLVEIPNEHGRLKDVDDILNRLALKPTYDAISALLSIQASIDESPTIVEASK